MRAKYDSDESRIPTKETTESRVLKGGEKDITTHFLLAFVGKWQNYAHNRCGLNRDLDLELVGYRNTIPNNMMSFNRYH